MALESMNDFNSTILENNLTNSEYIKKSIQNIIKSNKLDIVDYNPDYGTNLYQYISRGINDITIISVKNHIKRQLRINEDRITNVKVEVNSNPENSGLVIKVLYTEKISNIKQILELYYEL